jgi:hypothetical protein
MKQLKNIVMLLIVFLFNACDKEDTTPQPTTSQTTTINLTVNVVKQQSNGDEVNVPNADIRIYLSADDRSNDQNRFKQQYTNSNGITVFPLEAGTYYLRVQCQYGILFVNRSISANAVAAYETVIF